MFLITLHHCESFSLDPENAVFFNPTFDWSVGSLRHIPKIPIGWRTGNDRCVCAGVFEREKHGGSNVPGGILSLFVRITDLYRFVQV